MMEKNWIYIFIAILSYICLGFLQVSIDYQREIENLKSPIVLMPGEKAGSFILSGFKGIAVDILWLEIEKSWHSGQHYKILPSLKAISYLQPNYTTVWEIGAWHMAYNIFAKEAERGRRLERMFERMKEKMDFKENLGIILEIEKGIKKIKEKIEREGLPERENCEIIRKLKVYKSIIENLKKDTKNYSFLRIIDGIVESMLAQIFWYKSGIDFLKKGIVYNPDKYNLYFELGWLYFDKGKDYKNAVKYLEKAIKFPHPEYVDDVLAHVYEKNGQINKAIKQWEKLLDTNFREIAKKALRSLRKNGKFTP